MGHVEEPNDRIRKQEDQIENQHRSKKPEPPSKLILGLYARNLALVEADNIHVHDDIA